MSTVPGTTGGIGVRKHANKKGTTRQPEVPQSRPPGKTAQSCMQLSSVWVTALPLRRQFAADTIPNLGLGVHSIFRTTHGDMRLTVYPAASPLRLAIGDLFKSPQPSLSR